MLECVKNSCLYCLTSCTYWRYITSVMSRDIGQNAVSSKMIEKEQSWRYDFQSLVSRTSNVMQKHLVKVPLYNEYICSSIYISSKVKSHLPDT